MSKRAGEKEEEGAVSEDENKKKHKGGRPKGPPRMDSHLKKKYEECTVAITTLDDSLGGLCTDEMKKKAIKKKFEIAGKVDLIESGGEEILSFLTTDRKRKDDAIKEDHDTFDSKLQEYKKGCVFTAKEDNYLASLRTADLARLVEHEHFLEVCHHAIKHYKNICMFDKSDEAKKDQLIRTCIRELTDEENAHVKDTSRYASIQSQVADGDDDGDDDDGASAGAGGGGGGFMGFLQLGNGSK